MFLNKIKAEKDLLHLGKTIWIENSMPDIVLSFKKALADEEILFVGNTKNTVVDVDIPIPEDKKCMLTNGQNLQSGGKLHLEPYEYAVFI